VEAVARIRAMLPDAAKFCVRQHGYVDWKFGELAAYKGYAGALEYVQSVLRWIDFEKKYSDCLLITTFRAFQDAEQQLQQHETASLPSSTVLLDPG